MFFFFYFIFSYPSARIQLDLKQQNPHGPNSASLFTCLEEWLRLSETKLPISVSWVLLPFNYLFPNIKYLLLVAGIKFLEQFMNFSLLLYLPTNTSANAYTLTARHPKSDHSQLLAAITVVQMATSSCLYLQKPMKASPASALSSTLVYLPCNIWGESLKLIYMPSTVQNPP